MFIQANVTQDIPLVLKNIIGRKCAFHIKVYSYNHEDRDGYQSHLLSEIEAPTVNIQPPTPNKLAGPDKKQKIN